MLAGSAAAQPEGLLSLIEAIICSSSCTAAAVLHRWPILQQALSAYLSHSSSTARQGASAVLRAVARCDSTCVPHSTSKSVTCDDAPQTADAATTDTNGSTTTTTEAAAFSFVVQVLESLSVSWGDCSIDVSNTAATTTASTAANCNAVVISAESLPLPAAPQQSTATTNCSSTSSSDSNASVGAIPPTPPVHSKGCADSRHADSSTTADTVDTTVNASAVRSWQKWESVFMTYDAVLTDVLHEHLASLQSATSHTSVNTNSDSSSSSSDVLSRLKAAGLTAVLAAVASQLESVLGNPLFEHQFELRRISVQVSIAYKTATIVCTCLKHVI
jgi:hypothetical protein